MTDLYVFACGQLGLRYKEAREMTMWELNVKAEGHRRADIELTNKFRIHASILISPYAKKGAHINPRKIWPIDGEVIPKPSSEGSFKEAMEFFRNQKWIKKTEAWKNDRTH